MGTWNLIGRFFSLLSALLCERDDSLPTTRINKNEWARAGTVLNIFGAAAHRSQPPYRHIFSAYFWCCFALLLWVASLLFLSIIKKEILSSFMFIVCRFSLSCSLRSPPQHRHSTHMTRTGMMMRERDPGRNICYFSQKKRNTATEWRKPKYN